MFYAMFIGIFLFIFLSVFCTLRAIQKKQKESREKLEEIRKQFAEIIPNWKEAKAVKSIGLHLTPIYFLMAAVGGIAGILFGILWLHNNIAAVLLFIIGVALPQQILMQRELHRHEHIMEQLGTAVRIFAAEYNDTPHTFRALSNTAERLPEPIASIFKKTEQDYLMGKDSNDIFDSLSRELKIEYGKIFVQLLKISMIDEAVKPLFLKMAIRLTSQQELVRKNRKELMVDRVVSGMLNITMVPAFIVVNKIIPESHNFFVNTSPGKGIVVVCILSVMAGVMLDLFATKGAVYE